MKRIQLLTFSYVLFFACFTSVVFAQNISGTFEGLRKQYDINQQDFIKEFQYQYDLKQNGDQVNGISTIYNEKGEYAEVKLRGLIVGNTFYFEEYEIVDQIKDDFKVWCYKSGELQIITEKDKVYLKGETKSYTSNFGAPCTGGYTALSKTSSTYTNNNSQPSSNIVENLAVSLYPNPTIDESNISFQLNNENKVKIEVYDLNGGIVAAPLNKKLNAGNHNIKVNIGQASNGLYIVKMTVGKEVFSKQLIKAAS